MRGDAKGKFTVNVSGLFPTTVAMFINFPFNSLEQTNALSKPSQLRIIFFSFEPAGDADMAMNLLGGPCKIVAGNPP
jgi:hypothetical protein